MAGCDDSEDGTAASTEVTVCSTVGTTWWNQPIAAQRTRFRVELAVTPSRGNIDAVVGLSPGAATQWSSLAAILRLNEQGMFDARAGSVYRADAIVPYQAGVTYYARFEVDLARRVYTVAVGTTPGSYPSVIGRDYPFRTEHANTSWLDHVAGYVDPSVGGTIAVCDVTVFREETDPSCVASQPGGGFTNRAIAASSTVSVVKLDARPSTTNMDGVIGVANGPADSFSDLAAAMRFAANGTIEVRDGDSYRADTAVTYTPGQRYEVTLVIDLPSKTYSVFLRNQPYGMELTQIARGYRFRTQQQSVARLDHVAAIVDSQAGQLDVCNLAGRTPARALAIRDGVHDVQPLADGSALVSDGARTLRLDAGNVPRASVAAGGKVTADPAGNIYIASATSGALTVRSYTAALAARWTQTYAVPANAVGDIVVTSAGHLAVALGENGETSFRPTHVALIDSYGPWRGITPMFPGAAAIGMAPNGFAVANKRPEDGMVTIEVWRHGGPAAMIRARQVGTRFRVGQISLGPDDSVVFGGNLDAPLVFENCSIEPFVHPEVYWDAFVAALDAELGGRFCKRLTTEVTGIAHDASRIAVAYHTRTQLPYVDTVVYDPSGNVLSTTAEDAFAGSWGAPGRIALAPNGRLYLNVHASLGGPWDQRAPFLVTLSP